MKLEISLLLLATFFSANANQCDNIGGLQVYYDPSCSSQGGAGCNAGGQVNCRFCGWVFIYSFATSV